MDAAPAAVQVATPAVGVTQDVVVEVTAGVDVVDLTPGVVVVAVATAVASAAVEEADVVAARSSKPAQLPLINV